jgi:adenosylcobalamin-dependent ribonucleoside-triphosphate reductase
MFSTRAEIVAARTYCRPLNAEATRFETWPLVVDRVISHQRWLWERALGRKLNVAEKAELLELEALLLQRKVLLAGRTLWLGGTELSRRREVSQFNCSFLNIATVHDFVDAFWLLLNGCGVGFRPVPGTLNGFLRPIETVKVVRSTRSDKGHPHNVETFEDGVWTIRFGDSGEAWAKGLGKLIAGKKAAHTLVLDFSEVRPAGTRLAGYGWICSGDSVVAEEFPKIAAILSRRAGRLLTHIDILDVMNHLGVVQTGRRGAEIALYEHGAQGWGDFATAKKDYWLVGQSQRAQSNNSVVFWKKPSTAELTHVFDLMQASGGSEPGLINGASAQARAPWFNGVNPCAEILLSNKGFCNLVTTNIAAFSSDAGLHRAHFLVARANYRQTLVNLDDGILQRAWHENNEFLRLCGSSMTGIMQRPDLLNPYDLKVLRQHAHHGAYSMAEALGTQRPKNVTTIKPEGTGSKIMDATEGLHRPLGRFIFNNVTFSRHDPLVGPLRDAGYHVFDNPLQPDGVVCRFPVDWSTVPFTEVGGRQVNVETAIEQLDRYRLVMDNYVDQNASITVSYDPAEIPAIRDWLSENWDAYVGVSFLPRTDPTKTAEDLGYPYLPQEVVDKDAYENYVKRLKPVNLADVDGSDELVDADACATGVCPVR